MVEVSTEVVNELLEVKVERQLGTHGARTLLTGGGVLANRLLRRELEQLTRTLDVDLRLPGMDYCMDNAAMLGVTAHERLIRGERDPLHTTAMPTAKRTR